MKNKRFTALLCLILAALVLFSACGKKEEPTPSADIQQTPTPSEDGDNPDDPHPPDEPTPDEPTPDAKRLQYKSWNYGTQVAIEVDEENSTAVFTSISTDEYTGAKGSYVIKDGYMILRVSEAVNERFGYNGKYYNDFSTLEKGYVTVTDEYRENGIDKKETYPMVAYEKDGILYYNNEYGATLPIDYYQMIQLIIPVEAVNGEYFVNTAKPYKEYSSCEFLSFEIGESVSDTDIALEMDCFNSYYPTEIAPEQGTVDTSEAKSGKLTYKIGPATYEIPYYVYDPSAAYPTAYVTTYLPGNTSYHKGDAWIKKGSGTNVTVFSYETCDIDYASVESFDVTAAQLGIDPSKAGVQTVIYDINGYSFPIDVYVFEEGETIIYSDLYLVAEKNGAVDCTSLTADIFNYESGSSVEKTITPEMISLDTSTVGTKTATVTIEGVPYTVPAYVYESGQSKLLIDFDTQAFPTVIAQGGKIVLDSSSEIYYEYIDYSNGNTQSVSTKLRASMISVDTSKLGWTEATVSFGEYFTAKAWIYVVEKGDAASLTFGIRNIYIEVTQGAALSSIMDDISIDLTLASGTIVSFAGEDVNQYLIGLDKVDLNKVGTYYVHAIFDDLVATVGIKVIAPPPSTLLTGTSGNQIANTVNGAYEWEYYYQTAVYKLVVDQTSMLFVDGFSTASDESVELILLDAAFELCRMDSIYSSDTLLEERLDAGTYYILIGLTSDLTSDNIPFAWRIVPIAAQ